MARAAAFFSWIGIVVFAGLIVGTAVSWFEGSYGGSLGQWLLHELVQGTLLGVSIWGAIRSWRRRQALPPAERSKAGMGCTVVSCVLVAVIIGFAIVSGSTNRKLGREAVAAASPVVAALDRFKAAKKEYPRTLDQLVPEYLPAGPGCKAGAAQPRMAYSLDASSGQYELACPGSSLLRHRYRSATGQWDLAD